MNFWQDIKRPIIGLSPMDGITDAAFRKIVDVYGRPSVLFTEFVPVEALKAGAVRVLEAFIRHETSTPTVAQIYGTDLEGFYQGTFIICALGFAGVDINMGCPAKSVAARGAGAGLIRQPDHATSIIKAVKQATRDWAQGRPLREVVKTEDICRFIEAQQKALGILEVDTRVLRPVSVKTRVGYDIPITREWVSHLVLQEIDTLTVHGRTLKQLYTGRSNWDEIGIAAEVARSINPKITVLGSGDVSSLTDAKDKTTVYGLDGVLIGRGTWGNPWIFSGHIATVSERLTVAQEHAHLLHTMLPRAHFLSLRKHLAWYFTGFEGAAEVRKGMLTVKEAADVDRLVAQVRSTLTESE